MKKLLIVSTLLFAGSIGSIAQAQDRSPAIDQSTSTTTTHSSAQTEKAAKEQAMPRPKLKERQRREQQIEDRRPMTPPENPKRFRPDSLRRGGAVKVDTVRR